LDLKKKTWMEAAASIGDRLQAFDHLCHESDRLLDDIIARLDHLSHATAPIATRGLALIGAEDNILRTREAVDELISNLEASHKVGASALSLQQLMRFVQSTWDHAACSFYTCSLLSSFLNSIQVEVPLRLGPQRELDQYLKHLHTLDSAIHYLDQHSSLTSAQEAYAHAELVHGKAIKDCEAEFRAILTQQSSATMPSAQLLTTQAMDNLPSKWHHSLACMGRIMFAWDLYDSSISPFLSQTLLSTPTSSSSLGCPWSGSRS
jgi:hypothetical protein